MVKRARWQQAASDLCNRLAVDARNQRILADPWSRAAHSMVQAWSILRSQRRLPKRKSRPTPTTWPEAARRAAQDAAQRLQQVRRDPWTAWAAAQVTPRGRYVPKRDRPST
jgi:hypothetical protein